MNPTVLRVSVAILWGIVGLGLVFRKRLFPELAGEDAANNLTLAGYLALAFAGWNLLRVFLFNRKRRPKALPVSGAKPLTRRDDDPATPPRPFEYIPELDFTKPAPTGKTEPKV